jgi:hypothetical protein
MPADRDIVSNSEAPGGESVQTLTADLEGLVPRRRMRPSGGGNSGGAAANHVCVIETDEEEDGDDVVALDPPAQSGKRSERGQAAGVKPVGGGWGGGQSLLPHLSLIDNDSGTATPRPPGDSSRQEVEQEVEQEVVISDGDEDEVIMRNDEGVESEGAGAHARRIADDEAAVVASWSEISDTWQCTQCTLINSSSGDKRQPEAAKPPDLGSQIEGGPRKKVKRAQEATSLFKCKACAGFRWAPGQDEDAADPNYLYFPGLDVEDNEESIEESEKSQDPAEVEREVRDLEIEQFMSLGGVLERLEIPVHELLATYGRDVASR